MSSDEAPMPLKRLNSSEWALVRSQGAELAASQLVAGIKNPAQAVVKIWLGRELGISAAMAISDIHFIDGKPAVGINIMQALLARGGVTWEVEETDAACRVTLARPGWKPMVGEFGDVDARRANLLGRANWQRWPKAMRYARAFAIAARRIGSDLLGGLHYTPEELGADTDEAGRPVVDVETTAATEPPEPENPVRESIRTALCEMVGAASAAELTAAQRARATVICQELTGHARPASIPDEELADAAVKILERAGAVAADKLAKEIDGGE